MDKDTVTKLVIKEFGNHRSRDEIVRMLSLEYGYDWREADVLVKEVESTNKTRIARSQAPILLILSVVGIIGGLYLIVANVAALLTFNIDNPATYLAWRGVATLGTGILMVVGGLAGSVGVIRGMLK